MFKVSGNSKTVKAMCFVGTIGALLSLIGGWGGLDSLIRSGVRKKLQLIPNTTTWEKWKTIPVPVYIKFYLFNITNPEELEQGGQANLVEMGPYTYIIDFDKHNFIRDDLEDTYLYQDSKTYFFVPEMSNGSDTDLVTMINFIFVGASHVAHSFTDVDFLLEKVDVTLSENGERLCRTERVRDLIFDGISVQSVVDLLNHPAVQAGGDVKVPEAFKDGKFALFKGKNGTLDKWWEVHTGVRNYSEFGELTKYENKTELSYYKGESCNAINGSDGTLTPPFIEPGITEVYTFIPALCRSIKWQYDGESDRVNDGIPVARYKFPDILTPKEEPDLWCFCPGHDDSEKLEDPLNPCNIHGLASLALCNNGVPIIFSKPHFLDVDAEVRDLVSGLRPDPEKHQGYIDLHLLTGAKVQTYVTMQLSIELRNWEAMPSFVNASRAYIPFLWIEQSAELDSKTRNAMRGLASFLGLWKNLRFLLLFGFLAMGGMAGKSLYRNRNNEVANVENNEEKVNGTIVNVISKE